MLRLPIPPSFQVSLLPGNLFSVDLLRRHVSWIADTTQVQRTLSRAPSFSLAPEFALANLHTFPPCMLATASLLGHLEAEDIYCVILAWYVLSVPLFFFSLSCSPFLPPPRTRVPCAPHRATETPLARHSGARAGQPTSSTRGMPLRRCRCRWTHMNVYSRRTIHTGLSAA
ncbi:hypothetical protein C8R47DRAFT_1085402 [Mycena vitilis]|nr:hypothetical protein C8R47DRAFT_1085402 [Mycena vitilis]